MNQFISRSMKCMLLQAINDTIVLFQLPQFVIGEGLRLGSKTMQLICIYIPRKGNKVPTGMVE